MQARWLSTLVLTPDFAMPLKMSADSHTSRYVSPQSVESQVFDGPRLIFQTNTGYPQV